MSEFVWLNLFPMVNHVNVVQFVSFQFVQCLYGLNIDHVPYMLAILVRFFTCFYIDCLVIYFLSVWLFSLKFYSIDAIDKF